MDPEPETPHPEGERSPTTISEMSQVVSRITISEPEFIYSAEPEPEMGPYPEPESNSSLFAEPENNPEGEPGAMTISDPNTMRIMSAVSGVMASGIIIENLIVLYVIAKSWPRQSPTITYFIIHLACADLVSGLQFLWFNCIDVHLQITHNGTWILVLCGIWMVTIAASIGGIINFAHLRVHALKNAIKNQKYSKKRAFISIGMSWLLPTLVLFVPPVASWNCVGKISGQDCSQAVYPFTKVYVMLVAGLLFGAIIWLTVVYIWIFALVHRREHRLRAVKSISSKGKKKDTERQLFHTMMMILSIFLTCHLPVGIVLIFDSIITEPSTTLVDAFQIVLIISFLSPLLNPLVYYWRMPATKDSFWLAFGQRGRTQNRQQLSSGTSVSKKVDRAHSLSILDISNNRKVNVNSTAL